MDARRISAEFGQFLSACYQWHYFITLTLDLEGRIKHPLARQAQNVGGRIMAGQVHRFFWSLFHFSAVRAGGAVAVKDPDTGRVRYSGPLANAYRKKRGRFVYVFGLEPQRRDVLHAHALLYMPKYFDSLHKFDVFQSWPYGYNRTEEPESQSEVSDYVSKYVVKGGELYFSESFESNRLGRVA